MSNPLDNVLQRALSIRLNLQITLSSLPFVEEWMDIHLDRWLEHVPMPPEMPAGHQVSYLAMLGSDLRRMWWGAWGDPAGFVPKMADYFKLCNMAKSDDTVLNELGNALEPRLVGSWVGVWGGKVVTGWHFCDPHPWDKIEPLFGTHQAKFQLKKWVADQGVTRVERFTQSIGEGAYSELELAAPGDSVDDQVAHVIEAFRHFTGAPPPDGVVDAWRAAHPGFTISVRIRGGQVVRFAGAAPGLPLEAMGELCKAAKVGHDPKLDKLVPSMTSGGAARVEYGRAGDRAGVDVYVEPTEAPTAGGPKPAPAASDVN